MNQNNWPSVCEVSGCSDPGKLGHHHHTINGYTAVRVCKCGSPEIPGTRPKEK